ncbi:MAG: radical SAM protein [Nitrososphaeria archaeon]|jgi:pyruvate-formate lyase-activating enzyme
MTKIYQIVMFVDRSAYLTFDVCSWRCIYCVRNVSRWCSSLKEDQQNKLKNINPEYLTVEKAVSILKENGVHTAYLGGGEPTEDDEIKTLMKELKYNGINSWLITNGEMLDDELFELSYGITFSIKAIDEKLHIRLTGRQNKKVLENFLRYGKDLKVVAETVLYPHLIECDEIKKIAEFIDSVNRLTKLRIDLAIQSKDYKILESCVEEVKKLHQNTYYIKADKAYSTPELLYPII